jgi:hypothetical protein
MDAMKIRLVQFSASDVAIELAQLQTVLMTVKPRAPFQKRESDLMESFGLDANTP